MILLLLMMAQAAPFDIKNADALRRQHCAAEWPNDFQMQAHCIQMQIKGMGEFVAASKSVGRPLDAALERCVADWTKAGVPDWMMIGHCATQQSDSYRRLRPAPERGQR